MFLSGNRPSSELVDLARSRLTPEDSLVRLELQDALQADLSSVTLAFVFLPRAYLRELIPALLAQLPPGTRVVAHEQQALAGLPTPTRSRPLFSNAGLTVAHLWQMTAASGDHRPANKPTATPARM